LTAGSVWLWKQADGAILCRPRCRCLRDLSPLADAGALNQRDGKRIGLPRCSLPGSSGRQGRRRPTHGGPGHERAPASPARPGLSCRDERTSARRSPYVLIPPVRHAREAAQWAVEPARESVPSLAQSRPASERHPPAPRLAATGDGALAMLGPVPVRSCVNARHTTGAELRLGL